MAGLTVPKTPHTAHPPYGLRAIKKSDVIRRNQFFYCVLWYKSGKWYANIYII